MHNYTKSSYLLPLAIIVLLITLAPSIGSAKSASKTYSRFYDAGITSDQEMLGFFASFKSAVATGDRERVAAMVRYPLDVVTTARERLEITGREEFLAQYDTIFDESLKGKIAALQSATLITNKS
ncbi:MAG TPA: hypothetical protein VIU41_04775, partial [Geobacteraceae bacterium]